MRPIKYRAWNEEFGSMCYSTVGILFEKRRFYPFGIEVGFSHYPEEGWIFEQFTGLLDKNGKEIYEGDIVKDIDGVIGKVCFEDGMFCYAHYALVAKRIPVEVIGNIHENKELL